MGCDDETPETDFAMQHELVFTCFLIVVWVMEKLFLNVLKASPLLGQVVAGIVCGPALLDLVPFTACFKFVGKLGVLLLVIESGLAVDLDTLRSLGLRAFAAAALGVIMPVVLSLAIMTGIGGEGWKVSVAAGAAIAPTSLGFSAKLLTEVGQMQSRVGQLICTAAVIDDVLSLMVLSEIQALQEDSVTAGDLLLPLAGSLGTIAIGALLAVWLQPVMPKLANRSARIPTQYRANCILTALIVISTVVAFVCRLVGSSDLLGCFVGGLLFSSLPQAQQVWERQMKRFTRWGATLFFAATVGFEVPKLTGDGGMLQVDSLWRASVYTVIALVGKFSTGLFAKPLTWTSFNVLGWAMQGRGEFSLLIAAEALSDGIIDKATASGAVLAVLIASFLAPFGFRRYLAKEASHGGDVDGTPPAMVSGGGGQQKPTLDMGGQLRPVATTSVVVAASGGDEPAIALAAPSASTAGTGTQLAAAVHSDTSARSVEGDARVASARSSEGDARVASARSSAGDARVASARSSEGDARVASAPSEGAGASGVAITPSDGAVAAAETVQA